MALFRAFEIAWNPEAFVNGTFIDSESLRYAEVRQRAKEVVRAGFPDMKERRHFHLPSLFSLLLGYRAAIKGVMACASGFLEVSGAYACAYLKMREMNQVIRENMGIIDDILLSLISPEGKTFLVERLQREFGYPDVDLFEIDCEWT